MRKISILFIFLLLFSSTATLLAQGDDCSAASINRQIDSWYNDFISKRSEVDAQESIKAASDLQMKISNLLETCGVSSGAGGSEEVKQTGLGTAGSPYDTDVFGTAGDVQIMVTGDKRPADELLASEGVLPANQPPDTEYIIVYIEFDCSRDAAGGGCNLSSNAFQLVSDAGNFYKPAMFSFNEDVIETRDVPAGGKRTGGIPFLIGSSETGLTLLYYPSGDPVNEQPYYFVAQIAPLTVQVTTDQQSLAVRGGPGIVNGPVGDFRKGETGKATGISEDGEWLYIETDRVEGWVPVDQVNANMRLDGLPVRKFNP